MTLFEVLVLIFCLLFAFAYMLNRYGELYGINTAKKLFMITIMALTLGLLWFPVVLATDIYKKLNRIK